MNDTGSSSRLLEGLKTVGKVLLLPVVFAAGVAAYLASEAVAGLMIQIVTWPFQKALALTLEILPESLARIVSWGFAAFGFLLLGWTLFLTVMLYWRRPWD